MYRYFLSLVFSIYDSNGFNDSEVVGICSTIMSAVISESRKGKLPSLLVPFAAHKELCAQRHLLSNIFKPTLLMQIKLFLLQVGTWWYRSIKFSGDQVLLDTTQLFLYFFHKTTSVQMKRVIMILAASCEYDRKHNKEIIERMTDNDDVPAVSIHWSLNSSSKII